MKELLYIARISLGRILGCMGVVWIVYNPWFSLESWLGPQIVGNGDIEHGWPIKLLLALLAFGVIVGLVVTVRTALGNWWASLIVAVAAIVAYLPFYAGWVTLTERHVFYAFWFWVLPVLFGCALSAGYVVRYIKGTMSVQTVGHVNTGDGHIAGHVTMPDAHHPTT